MEIKWLQKAMDQRGAMSKVFFFWVFFLLFLGFVFGLGEARGWFGREASGGQGLILGANRNSTVQHIHTLACMHVYLFCIKLKLSSQSIK